MNPKIALIPNPVVLSVGIIPLTVEQILEETGHWPRGKVDELVDRLTDDQHRSSVEIENAWRIEIDRRVEEIHTGKVQGIPGDEMSSRIRGILGR